MINSDAAFDQQLFHVAVGKPVAQVPTHRDQDHIRWESKASKRGPRRTYSTRATTHQLTLPEPIIRQRNCEDRRVPPEVLI
jgi:hypothetical protein